MDATHLRIEALLGADDHARRELRARARAANPDGWVELQKERTPEPGWLKRSARGAWRQLADAGRARVAEWIGGGGEAGDQPRELEGWLIPVWRGDNDIAEPVTDGWGPAALLLADSPAVGDALFIDEMLPEEWAAGLPAAYRIRWMRQPVLRLVSEGDVASGAPLETAGDFALHRVEIDTLVAVLDIRPVSSGPVPTESLPAYTEQLVPVPGLAPLEAELAASLRERLDALVP